MKSLYLTIIVAGALALSLSPVAAQKRIKIATLAPEGTSWMKVMNDMAKEIAQKTSGEVKLKFYSGGVMGDEGDVIRKMKFGQVHGGGFTGRGLGEINPEERVLELPRLFEKSSEVDCVLSKVTGKLSSGFEAKDTVLLGWAETGFVYVFTNKPIRTADDMKGVKMWMWEGDPLAEALFKANGLVPVPLDLPNVLTSMQTGLIDAVYSSPYAMVAMQWHTRVKFMNSAKLTWASGALLVSKKEFSKLSETEQATVKEIAARYLRKLTEQTRKENDDAMAVLKKAGIQIIDMAPAEVTKVENASKKVYDQLVGKLYTKDLLTEVVRHRDACRAGK
ncbi:MAG: TRAP transporter substrate-binding protein DctP [Myxococcota bacterium]|jgi:TRAP-type C4-dicarboxylate transport system substrate-binding protein|nr:TRAP transporter substrate-binding protein DctP [Myxococcota bacterium]